MAPLPGTEDGPLNREKVFKETKWIIYCCCEGWGLGPFSDPLIGAEVKELCLRSSVKTTDIMGEDGLCKSQEICLCLTSQCQFPPVKEAPVCACLNMKCGGSMGSTEFKSEVGFEQSKIMNDTFWIQYFLCNGVGINKMDQGLFTSEFKELCCRGYTNIEPPVIDGVLCGQVGTECCIWDECQLPPAANNPKIAICTWRMNKG